MRRSLGAEIVPYGAYESERISEAAPEESGGVRIPVQRRGRSSGR